MVALPAHLQKQVDDFKILCDELWARDRERDQFRRDAAWARRTAGFTPKQSFSEVHSGDPADDDTEMEYSRTTPQASTSGRL